jgi:L-lactate dehydrogenase complex protein LldG
MNEILEKIKKYSIPLEKKAKLSNIDTKVISNESLLSQFEKEAIQTGSKVFICKNHDDVLKAINKILSDYSSAIISNLVPNSIAEKIKSESTQKIFSLLDIDDDFKNKLSKIDVSLSVPEFIIAETGTAIIRSSDDEPRLLSLLSKVNIMLAKKENLVESMISFLAIAKKQIEDFNKTSAYVFITGPSRTADIEKNLVIGVHGPKEQVFILY